MRLDRIHSPTESALRQRHEAAQIGGGAGFDVASIRQYESSSASGFGSKASMTASSFHTHDDVYESSDYRVSIHVHAHTWVAGVCVHMCVFGIVVEGG